MSMDEEEVSVLWSKLPAQLHQSLGDEPDCIILDSPPESPPRDKLIGMADSQPTTSTGFVGFSNIVLANIVPQQLDTPEDSDPEQKNGLPDDAASTKKKNRRKKKKKAKQNPLLVEKMIEQIKEAGVLERNKEMRESEEAGLFERKRKRTESEDSTKYPRVKWQRYFEAESPKYFNSGEEEKPDNSKWKMKKTAERAERMARVRNGRVSKLQRYGARRIRCFNCNQWGHTKEACPDKIKPTKCSMCGAVGHVMEYCPRAMCLNCGTKTNSFSDICRGCRDSGSLLCDRCRCRGHKADNCPELWRRFYATVTGDGSNISNKTKLGYSSLKPAHKLFCSGCAKRGHSIDTCNYSRNIFNTCGHSFVTSPLDADQFKNCRRPKHDREEDIHKRFKKDLFG